jgi:transglutaminase-like putative cysteine protease
LTQALVSVGIIATDLAAETTMSVWAILLSWIGAMWSWFRRRDRNVGTKLLLAIGMLAALMLFFHTLLWGRELNDTRLTLVRLLVQVQVLHSFDLPRRKDLGYSMVIGLILMGVASTLSQTMVFGGMLLLFLALALPVLVMDYRARLGVRACQPVGLKGGTRRADRPKEIGLPGIFIVIVALGLVIFVAMPRLPGYQLRSFPMSALISTQGKFDNQSVINPGYIRQGEVPRESGQFGQGTSAQQGTGQVDQTYYYGFNRRINQNLRGEMVPQVVMRVRSQAEGFWRVMGFDRYTGQGWEISRNDRTQTLSRPSWSYQFFLTPKLRSTRTQQVVQTYTLVSDLPNVIPALDQPIEVFFPTEQVAVDPEDGLRSPLPLTTGLTYTVISQVAERDRTRLQQARSTFPQQRDNPYLQIPAPLAPRLKQVAQDLLATANRPITSDYEKALFLAQALKQRYTIQVDIPPLAPNQDLVEAFLFEHQGGAPDHFPTVLTMLLRSIGISARLATGFAPGQFNPFTGLYIVKNTDAYAVTEVYFHRYGWFAFDPIPGHPLTPPTIQPDQSFSLLRRVWNWVAGWLPSPVTSWLNWFVGGLLSRVGQLLSQWLALFSRGWLGWLVGAMLLTGVGWLGWLGWLGWQRWRYWRQLRRLAPMERLYRQLLDWLSTQGLTKHPAQTPWEYARQVQAQAKDIDQGATVETITQAYMAWRYGVQGGQEPALNHLHQQLRRSQTAARRQVWVQRYRALRNWRP